MCFIEYGKVKDESLIFKFLSFEKCWSLELYNKLKDRFTNTYKLCNNDLKKTAVMFC